MSVIIPTKNEADVITECLTSIFDQSIKPHEILIVDGGSTDNTLEIARSFNVTIIEEGEFSSPANARNLGVENSKGEILLIMDADVLLHKDCVNNALRAFKDEDVITVLPYELGQDHSYLEFIQRKWNEGTRTSINIGLKKAKTSGGVAFFRRNVFEKIRYNTAYGFGEDDDFSTRLEKEFSEYKIVAVKNCQVISHSPHSMRELAVRYMWWGRTFLTYFAEHFGGKALLNLASLILPASFTFSVLIWLTFPQTAVIFYLFLLVFSLRIVTVCFRSRSVLFIQFAFFDVVRSLFFIVGLVQSLFVRKKGR